MHPSAGGAIVRTALSFCVPAIVPPLIQAAIEKRIKQEKREKELIRCGKDKHFYGLIEIVRGLAALISLNEDPRLAVVFEYYTSGTWNKDQGEGRGLRIGKLSFTSSG